MARTFLDYLTQPNPQSIVHNKAAGYSTATKASYRPDKCSLWEDITWENLEATFGNVLKQPMCAPQISHATDVPPEKMEIFEEDSVSQLVVAWNEPVLRHVFKGTYTAMCRINPRGAFQQGIIHFEKNTGRGHLKSPDGWKQKPDWCVYQRVPGLGPYYPNIAPGESKPAGKWKSKWIHSKTSNFNSRAQYVMAQMTKYMWEAKTRYGFILSEEELVPVRLSVLSREKPAKRLDHKGIMDSDIMAKTDIFFDQEDQGDQGEQGGGSSRNSDAASNASFADDSRKTGLQVEYSCIPWEASGKKVLTINLALWWISVLAVQVNTIKLAGTYTSLGNSTRGQSPDLDLHQTEQDMLDRFYSSKEGPRKRKADEQEEEEDNDDSSVTSPSSTADECLRDVDVSKGLSSVEAGSSARGYLYDTTRPVEEQSFNSYSSTPRLLRRSKRRRRQSEAGSVHDEDSQGADKFVNSFCSTE